MHRVGSAGNTSNSSRPRKEKRLTYVLNDADDTKHSAGVNCLAVLKSLGADGCDYLFTGSRDGTLKRWALMEDAATCSTTFESHVDWVNDAVLAGDNTLVSCSSDTTLKTWNCLTDGTCTRTLRQHSDYVTCLAAAEKNSNIVASGGLGGEVFVWDLESALVPLSKSGDAMEEDSPNGISGSGNSLPITSLHTISSSNSISTHTNQSNGYVPIAAKGHKESVYALAMSDSGTLLVSGGTEKVVRVWDPRTGSKTMKLRGHTDNIRTLLLDSTGRLCLSGSSDSMIRLWDLGQQRCVHSYAVHTDSVWALASTPTFSHVYSGGRDLSLYLTDLATRESLLLCTGEHPILQLALQDDNIWVATSDSSINRWPAEGRNPQKVFQRGGSFLAGNLSFSRARVSLEGSTPVPVYKEPTLIIPGTPGIVQHEILNNRRNVLTKDTFGSVKLWEISRGIVIENYGKVSFEEKKEELFEMVSIPAWFTVDTRLGSLSIHLDTPQCFSAEMYSTDLNIIGKPEDDKVNLARETLKGLLAHWLAKQKQRFGSQPSANGDVSSGKDISHRSLTHSRIEVDFNAENDAMVYPPFEFSTVFPPSIITQGSHGGPWRKKITDLDGTEDEKDFPFWCLDCVLNNRLPPRENTKCSFYLHPCEGSAVQILTQGKLSAPRILRIQKVVNYVIEKMVLDKPVDGINTDGTFASGLVGGQLTHTVVGDGSFRSGLKPWQKLKPAIEILCNNQVLSPDMSLATVRGYIWKKSEDLILNYRVVQGR
ncbi:WD repeat-containing protein 48-like [Juglans microcarpa x Juglans regia]|uniref:WD repeat-containing protein 48-like n=1 Tax=Juglans microcarpa x Juglans regia TaxID=2249226 RepID=UPI001B7F1F4D|nr:WD repeat-containing protein 48-like [Juglans microcarpa x Juglans regia]XP_041021075.1 WD repeat-containing protein 48-like [Juglans microcarpa x Juglans regia]XP_041021076.1 WD repeat-containing protein 48-like [Juglans microcarpa x Juglans regia]XP_041021078.1 WD repeat-containing protein 48-like [Juglans microcarpa x Juglans regia]XP_041021079.1 WD repeat-containing protein 48-like [Juglans microcarpa x Juglans regia]